MENKATRIGLGMAAIGRPHYINIRQEAISNDDLHEFRARGLAVLDEAYRLGIRYFDTAPGYGMAEEMLRDWLRAHPKHDAEAATKWGYTYTAGFRADAMVHEVKEHSLGKLNEQWEGSQPMLPRLTTYQIHSATFESGVLQNAPVLDRLAELKSQHGLKIGLSASGTRQREVVEAAREIERDGKPLFEVFQVTYNVLEQRLAGTIRDLMASGMRVIIKEALANGRLFPSQRFPHYAGLYRAMERLAAKYGVGIDAVALRFCLDQVAPYRVLSGASSIEHIRQNMRAVSFTLTAEERAGLEAFAVATNEYWAERKQLNWN